MENHGLPMHVDLALPDWIESMLPSLTKTYPSNEDKMQLAIDLAARNVAEGTGGPFGAAIFDSRSGRIISVGVNRVVPLRNSAAHAEMLAFMLAQSKLQSHRLDATKNQFTMATSAQPCAMCYGASVWAGINHILIGARREDVESLTEFDEGPLPRNWISRLKKRGIRVTRDILRSRAREVLKIYEEREGTPY